MGTTFKYQTVINIDPIEVKTPSYTFKSEKTSLNLDIFSTPISNPSNSKDIQYPSFGNIIAKRTKNVMKGGFLELILEVFPVVTFQDKTTNIDSLDINEYFLLAFFTTEKIVLQFSVGESSYSEPIRIEPVKEFSSVQLWTTITEEPISTNLIMNDDNKFSVSGDYLEIGEFVISAPEGKYIFPGYRIFMDSVYMAFMDWDVKSNAYVPRKFIKEVNGEVIEGIATKVRICTARNLDNFLEQNDKIFYSLSDFEVYFTEVNYNGNHEVHFIDDLERDEYKYNILPLLDVYANGEIFILWGNWTYSRVYSERLESIYAKAPNDGYGVGLTYNPEISGMTDSTFLEVSNVEIITPKNTYNIKEPFTLDILSYKKLHSKTIGGVVVMGATTMLIVFLTRDSSGKIVFVVAPYITYENGMNNQEDLMTILYDLDPVTNAPKSMKDMLTLCYIDFPISKDFVYTNASTIQYTTISKLPVYHIPLNSITMEGENSISVINHNGTSSPIFKDGKSFREYFTGLTNLSSPVQISTKFGEVVRNYALSNSIILNFNDYSRKSYIFGTNSNPSEVDIVSYIGAWEEFITKLIFEDKTLQARMDYYSNVGISQNASSYMLNPDTYYINGYDGKAYPFKLRYKIYFAKPYGYIEDNPVTESKLILAYIVTGSVNSIIPGRSRGDVIDFALQRLLSPQRAVLFNDSNVSVDAIFFLNNIYTDEVINRIVSGGVYYQTIPGTNAVSLNGNNAMSMSWENGFDTFPFMEIIGNKVKFLTPYQIYTYSNFLRPPKIFYGEEISESNMDYSLLFTINKDNSAFPTIIGNADGMKYYLDGKSVLPSGFSLNQDTGEITGSSKSSLQATVSIVAMNDLYEYKTQFTMRILPLELAQVEYKNPNTFDRLSYNMYSQGLSITPKIGTTGVIPDTFVMLKGDSRSKQAILTLNPTTGAFSYRDYFPGVTEFIIRASDSKQTAIRDVRFIVNVRFEVSGFAEVVEDEHYIREGWCIEEASHYYCLNKGIAFGSMGDKTPMRIGSPISPPPTGEIGVTLAGVYKFKLKDGISGSSDLPQGVREGVVIAFLGDDQNSFLNFNNVLYVNDIPLSRWDFYYGRKYYNLVTYYRFAPLPKDFSFKDSVVKLTII